MAGETEALLIGLPLSVKDLTAVKGVRFTSGSRTLADFVAPVDSPASERVQAHGAAIIGKTTTTEFGCKASSDSPLTGITRNPWNLDKTTGGSSAGAGASIAAGITPFALGTDGGGSIRIPSSFCGLFGIKAQFGRVPVFPVAATPTLAHVGPMARTVRDAALLLTAISGFDARDPASVAAEVPAYLVPASARRKDCESPGARRSAMPVRHRRCARSQARPHACSRSSAARSSWSRSFSTIPSSCGWPSSMPASARGSRSHSPSTVISSTLRSSTSSEMRSIRPSTNITGASLRATSSARKSGSSSWATIC